MELEQVLHLRQTTRKYLSGQIKRKDLEKILEAAQTASLAAGDDKTTHITVVQDELLAEEIRQACMLVSPKTGRQVDPFYGASTIIFLSAADISEDHIEYCNVACVIENMILQATALGLGSTYIWGCLRKLRQHPEVTAKLNLPEGFEILSALVIGYPAHPLAPREKREKIGVDYIVM